MDPKHPTTMDTAAESTVDPQLAATVDSRPRHAGLVIGRGALLGRYLVLGELGAGAMGVVYAAHDPELDRKIALKLLKSNEGSADARARLLREAQSMARLAHPNVIAVHDVGTFGDEVFVAMEFVQGVTLTRWLADKARGWREVLEVFITAGRGLKAAHDAGMIHRDLKPDNIMVGEDGRVRVMDFGLARAEAVHARAVVDASVTDAPVTPHLTNTGSLVGTPAYMAPEQWECAVIDARADQFAFCVALWEGLHGERPFRGETRGSLMLAVTSGRRVVPRDPKRAPPWLRRILERGLATSPDLRWPSMDALLRELTRDRLVRTRRWLTVGLGAVLLVAGVLGVQQVLDMRAVAAAEREHADVAHEEALRAVAVAEDRLSAANTVVKRILSEVLPRLQRISGSAGVQRKIHTYLEDLQATLLPNARDDEDALDNRMSQHLHRGELALTHDNLDLARQEFNAALQLAEQRIGRDPANTEARGDLAFFLMKLGDVESKSGDLATARRLYQRTVSIHDKLMEEQPSIRGDIAYSLQRLGDVEKVSGDLAAARLLYDRALAINEELAKSKNHSVNHRELSSTLQRIGDVEYLASNLDAARLLFERSLSIREKLASDEPESSFYQNFLALSLNRLGAVEVAAGNLPAAGLHYDRALSISEKLVTADPENIDLRRDLAVSLNTRGGVEAAAENPAASRPLVKRSLSILEKIAKDDPQAIYIHRDISGSLSLLASIEQAAGDFAAARPLFERALSILEKMMNDDPQDAYLRRDILAPLMGLGDVAENAGDLTAARLLFERALSILEMSATDDSRPTQNARITCHLRLGDLAFKENDLNGQREHLAAADRLQGQMAVEGQGQGFVEREAEHRGRSSAFTASGVKP